MKTFLDRHVHVLLYAGFWLSMAIYGLVAPPDRVAMLGSSLVTEGWHLSAMALCLGGPVLWLYWLRMSGRWR